MQVDLLRSKCYLGGYRECNRRGLTSIILFDDLAHVIRRQFRNHPFYQTNFNLFLVFQNTTISNRLKLRCIKLKIKLNWYLSKVVKVQLLCDLVECFLSSRSFIRRNTLSAWQIRSCRVAWLAAQSNTRLSCCVLYVTSYSILLGIYLSLSVLREHKRYRSRVWNAKQHFAGTAPALETRVGGYTVFVGATFAVGAGKRRSFFRAG